MPRIARLRKLAIPLVLCLALLTPWSAEARPLAGSLEPLAGVVSRFADWLTALFDDIGCSMDPDGRCDVTTMPPPPSDNLEIGCSMDPSGVCGHHP